MSAPKDRRLIGRHGLLRSPCVVQCGVPELSSRLTRTLPVPRQSFSNRATALSCNSVDAEISPSGRRVQPSPAVESGLISLRSWLSSISLHATILAVLLAGWMAQPTERPLLREQVIDLVFAESAVSPPAPDAAIQERDNQAIAELRQAPSELPPPEPAPLEPVSAKALTSVQPEPKLPEAASGASLPTMTLEPARAPASASQPRSPPQAEPPRPPPRPARAVPKPRPADSAPKLAAATQDVSHLPPMDVAPVPAAEPALTPPNVAALAGPTTGPRPRAGNPKPDYPIQARNRSLEGRVVLRIAVSAAGVPERVDVLSSSGYAILDDAAAAKVRQSWRFEPATRGGVPVEGSIDAPIRFTLQE